jgi:CheY-like chemotaxis protein
VVDDVLDLSKIEAGRLDLEDIPFDLIGCVEDALGIVTAAAEEKGLALAVRFGQDTPHIVGGDPVRIRQILVNLLANAVKFTSRGEVVVDVEMTPGPAPGCRLTFHVRDTGIGIAPDVIDRIFSRFGQAEAATARTFGGTGLGLSICRQLAQLMGGDLTVFSTVGVGSTFSCAVVLRVVPANPPETPLSGRHVLVVHDHEASAQALTRHLSRWGATTASFSTVDQAVDDVPAWERAALAVVGSIRYSPQFVDGAHRLSHARHGPPLPIVAVIPLGARNQLSPPPEHIRAAVCMPVRRGQLREAVFAAMGQPAPAPAGPSGATDAANAVESAARSASGEADSAAPRDILHIDDDPMLATLVRRILASRPDLNLLSATHGRTAIEMLARTRPVLILLDLRLPDMPGEELLQRLHADAETRDIPVVVLSGDTTPETMTRLLTHGATEYLAKPFTASQLRGLVADLIDGR